MATLPKVSRQRATLQDFAVLDKMVRGGVSKDVAQMAKGFLPEEQLVRTIFEGAQVQGGGRKTTKKPPLDNAKATRLAYLVSLAEDVFGSRKAAMTFMTRHHAKLGATPLEKLETEWGGREVERILQSVIHGLPA